MKALIVMHDPLSGAGLVEALLVEQGASVEHFLVAKSVADSNRAVAFPDPLNFDVIVSTGATWSINDESSVGEWIEDEVGLIRRAVVNERPVVGLCFGGQVLSIALGGSVARAAEPAVGWMEVQSLDERVSPGPWLHWHYDQFTAPPGSRVLAESLGGAASAFVAGRSIGTQFHPEAEVDLVSSWVDGVEEELAAAETSSEHLLGEFPSLSVNRSQCEGLLSVVLPEFFVDGAA